MIRKYGYLLLFLFFSASVGYTQVRATTEIKWKDNVIRIDTLSGWMWKPGQDSSSLNSTSQWELLQPKELNASMADKNGKLEGWFKFRFRFDKNFDLATLYFLKCRFEPVEIFINHQSIGGFGIMNKTKDLNNKHFPNIWNRIPYDFEAEKDYTLMVHVLDHTYGYPPKLMPSALTGAFCFLQLTPISRIEKIEANNKRRDFYVTISMSVCFTLSILMWLLFILYPKNKELLFVAIFITMYFPYTYSIFIINHTSDFITWNIGIWSRDILLVGGLAFVPVLISYIFIQSVSKWLWINFILQSVIMTINNLTTWSLPPFIILLSISFVMTLVLFIRHWHQVIGAKWAVFIGAIITIIGSIVNTLFMIFYNQTYEVIDRFLGLVFPFFLVVYTAINFKQIMTTVQGHAEKIASMAREKEQLILLQNEKLENQVNERTQELKTSLANLKSTQAQLIHSEKMASLGELTAGIAHEIQNPLNFVNNFSEVSTEILDEVDEELEKGEVAEARNIINELRENLGKINHHGHRASGIVKSMLDHSRAGSGEKVDSDINVLCEEYLRLAYNGTRAKVGSFNVTLETSFDESLPKIKVVPQDIGRVLMNLINNAFQALSDMQKVNDPKKKEPIVTVSTKNHDDHVLITVSDNGPGIPDDIKDKIFQPFFTTKPTGQGTGLGLSLSYDIIKAHGGEISLESHQGKGSVFKISIPV